MKIKKQTLVYLLAYVSGVCVGLLPWIIFVIQAGWHSAIGESLGSAVSLSNGNYFITMLEHIRNFLLFGITALFGLRPPWGVNLLVIPLIPVVLPIWIFIFLKGIQQKKSENHKLIILIVFSICIILLLGFILTPFGNDPSGRYFLPVYQMVAILAGIELYEGMKKPVIYSLCVAIIVCFHLVGTIQCAQKNPPGITTQFDSITQIDHAFDEELIEFLREEGELTGFTNYWVAYPLAFLSNEELIFIPELPYHQDFRFTSRDNRYQPYIEKVNKSNRVAFITTNHPQLNDRLRVEFRKADITWMEKQIGDYQVFYHLSSPVYPDNLDLGLVQ